jgi:predicted transcriptional regulator of viral defense system
MALSRLAQAGEICRIGRGLYDYPQLHDKLGALTPDAEMIAQAVSAQSGDRRALGSGSGEQLGLSTQVPARTSYATTGRTRVHQAAGRSVTLKHSRAPVLGNASEAANGVVQYLAGLGRDNVDADAISQLAARLDNKDVQHCSRVARRCPVGWAMSC